MQHETTSNSPDSRHDDIKGQELRSPALRSGSHLGFKTLAAVMEHGAWSHIPRGYPAEANEALVMQTFDKRGRNSNGRRSLSGESSEFRSQGPLLWPSSVLGNLKRNYSTIL